MVNYADVNDQYRANKDLKKEDVQNLLEWMQLQPHLPKISELQMIIFLHSCYYSNEATKQCIDNYYTVRAHCPEFFAARNPFNADQRLILQSVIITPLDKLTPDGSIIYYARLIDSNPEMYNFNVAIKLFDMCTSLTLQEAGALHGEIIIMDLEGATLTHVLKTGILSVKKYLYYLQEAIPFRLKAFHYVNAVPFMDKIMALMKPFMKKELHDLIQIHQGNTETIFKSIPRDCLPNEIGGTCGSALEMHKKFIKKLEANKDFFLEEEKLIVDETRRPGKPKNASELFGVEGTFKKLDID